MSHKHDNNNFSGSGPDRKRKNYALYGGLSMIAFLVLSMFITWVFFFQPVGVNEYGILVNTVDNTIDTSRVYDNGRYLVPFGSFIIFPSTLQSVDFSDTSSYGMLSARSNDGLDVSFHLNIQYKITKAQVIPVYKEFGMKYPDAIVQIARGTVRTIASKYNAIQYFNNDTLIENDMMSGLTSALLDHNVTLSILNVLAVFLPQSFEDALTAVQVAQQQIQQKKYEQNAAVIEAQTKIIQAQAEMNITIIEANATAQAQIIAATATAQSLNITLTAKGEAFATMMVETGFNQTQLLTYLWIDAILNSNAEYLIIGANTPIILNSTNSTALI